MGTRAQNEDARWWAHGDLVPRRTKLRTLKKRKSRARRWSWRIIGRTMRDACGRPIDSDRAHRLGYADVPREGCSRKRCACSIFRHAPADFEMGSIVSEAPYHRVNRYTYEGA